eukprot:gene12231-25682_t
MAAPRGDFFIAEAQKALNRTLIFGFGKNQKFEDAAEAYVKAGNAYKISKQWKEAGDAYLKAADCQNKTDSPNDSCNSYIEAGNSFRNCSANDAVASYQKAIAIFNDTGRFSQSARYYKEIAEIYEQDNNLALAIENYQQSADIQLSENKKQAAQQCLIKIATLASSIDDAGIQRGAEIFESLGRDSMTTTLGAYSAKGYFLQAAMCHLAVGDNVATRSKISAFKNADYSFGPSRECQFVEKLID